MNSIVEQRIRSGGARARYTEEEQAAMIKQDLLNDAKFSENQAANGPFYPELGITKENLLKYARECREIAALNLSANSFIFSK